MYTQPAIDILLAAYNGQDYIKEQIDSILAQSCQDWQLLVRDDGSQDQTLKIAKEYAGKHPDKIKLIEDDDKHMGASLNFNRLLENSTAEYIMFSDQDDVWLPNKIKATFDLMKVTEKLYPQKPILVHTDLRVVDSKLNPIAKSLWHYQGIFPKAEEDFDRVMLQNVATGCTIMINKKAKEISIPVSNQAVMHDWWIAINVAKYGKIVHIPDQLVLYRQHTNNVVGAKKFSEAPKSLVAPKIPFIFRYYYELKERTLNHYNMVKTHDPNVVFWRFFLKKVSNKILRTFKMR